LTAAADPDVARWAEQLRLAAQERARERQGEISRRENVPEQPDDPAPGKAVRQ
jgi:hypothetical protein